jgi:hypothetical protein
MLVKTSLMMFVVLFVGNCLVIFGSIVHPVGVKVSHADFVRSGSIYGAGCTQAFDSTKTVCGGSKYSDGTACGTTSETVLKAAPYTGTRKYASKSCSTKTVNGMQVTCGSAQTDGHCS